MPTSVNDFNIFNPGSLGEMKHRIALTQYIFFVALACLAPSTFAQISDISQKRAPNESTVVQREMAQLKNANRVEIYFLKPFQESLSAKEEPDLKEFGCKYTSSKPNEIESLVKIVSDAQIKFNKKLPVRGGVIQGLYFYSNDGVVTKLILDQFFFDDVKYSSGALNKNLVVADHSLPFRIYDWASKLSLSDSQCSDFINFYKNKS